MKLFAVSLTGADDTTDPQDLIALSREFPFVEWAILFSETRQGSARYPSAEWISELNQAVLALSIAERPRLAAHLCGATMRKLMGGDETWLQSHCLRRFSYDEIFGRTQLNFNAAREKFTAEKILAMFADWRYDMTGCLITQEHGGNIGISDAIQDFEMSSPRPYMRMHQVLHDASGGRGQMPDGWPRPIAGVLNGYAGGISPDNVLTSLHGIAEMVGSGFCWIDMESNLRNAEDRFDLTRARAVLEEVAAAGAEHGWLACSKAA